MSDRASMGRRDFLLLRRRGSERILALSCERLYMRWADARSGAGTLDTPDGAEWRPGEGEPPTDLAPTTPEAIFRELEESLLGADTLRLLDAEWLDHRELAREVRARVDTFRARGGRVE